MEFNSNLIDMHKNRPITKYTYYNKILLDIDVRVKRTLFLGIHNICHIINTVTGMENPR